MVKIKKTILVTGSAGFIGSALSLRLLKRGDLVIGIDNHNDYYSQQLKEDRLKRHKDYSNYIHIRSNLTDDAALEKLFSAYQPKYVINLAAQAGVRYSMTNPLAYIDSNIIGFANIIEKCRNYKVRHLVYASTSSVYGANTLLPFSENASANHPLSLYAATKKSNELMAHSYSHLYNFPTTGLRFFTVYGPWGRPDMALFKFTKAILAGEPIDLFNYGKHSRDFTYIDDIVEGIVLALDHSASPNLNWNSKEPDPASSKAPWRIYNIGNSKAVQLRDYIHALEINLNKKALVNELPLQPGDVPDTYADIKNITQDFGYRPITPVSEGVRKFVDWYKEYFQK